jgi:MFS family permease
VSLSQEHTRDVTREPSPFPGISRNVYLLALVSLFTDLSSEMIYPLVPLFLSGQLGAPVAVIGLIEGIAESTASLFKWVSGAWSDRLAMRKPFLLVGYGLAAVTKPLMALAFAWPLVLVARVLDRLGKGLRGGPRDALIGDSVAPEVRGRSFGFHRSGDSIGAVLGPLLAIAVLGLFHGSFRTAFVVAFVPGFLSTLLILPVREVRPPVKVRAASSIWRLGAGNPALRRFLVVVFVFAIGNSSDMFLILRASQLGVGSTTAVLMFALASFLNVLSSYPAGIASDRLGRKGVLITGFLLFAGVYFGFGMASSPALLWGLFAVYGVYLGLTDGVTKALIVDFTPQGERGAALGLQAAVLGICTLPASVIAGALWQYGGPAWTFLYGAATAIGAALLLAYFLTSGKLKAG